MAAAERLNAMCSFRSGRKIHQNFNSDCNDYNVESSDINFHHSKFQSEKQEYMNNDQSNNSHTHVDTYTHTHTQKPFSVDG